MDEKKARLWVELTCADPAMVFRGEWPGLDESEAIVAFAREMAMASGLPVQIEIRGYGAWSIAPSGKVLTGRLCCREKLPPSRLPNQPSGG